MMILILFSIAFVSSVFAHKNSSSEPCEKDQIHAHCSVIKAVSDQPLSSDHSHENHLCSMCYHLSINTVNSVDFNFFIPASALISTYHFTYRNPVIETPKRPPLAK